MNQARILRKHRKSNVQRGQRGLALIFVLIMMLLVFSVAALSVRIGTQGTRIAGAERDRNVAFQGAEAALLDAEMDIFDPALSDRACTLLDKAVEPGCSSGGESKGICAMDPAQPNKPVYKLVDFEESNPDERKYAIYGEFTRRQYSFKGSADTAESFSSAATPASPPKYIIERVSLASPLQATDSNGVSKPLGTGLNLGTFLVTALGYGYSKNTQVMLQALIIYPKKAGRCAGDALQ
jgi:type IV pilus assembly protein PilX